MDIIFQVLHDISCLVTELSGGYLDSVLQHLSSCPTEAIELVKQSILQGGKSLESVLPQIVETVSESLVEKCVEVSCLYCQGIIHSKCWEENTCLCGV